MGFFIAVAVLALLGFGLMLWNFIDLPQDNDSGPQCYGLMEADWHPRLPPGNRE